MEQNVIEKRQSKNPQITRILLLNILHQIKEQFKFKAKF